MFERLTIGLGIEGMGYRADRFAAGDRRRRGAPRPTPRCASRLGEIAAELLAVQFTGYRALTALSARPDPRPGGRAGEGHARQRRDRGGRPDRRRRSAPTRSRTTSEWAYMISFLPGLKSAGGTEEILRNTIGERVLGLPPEPRLDKGIPFSELRAKERRRRCRMNFALSDEQVLLREAARGALVARKTVEAARDALEDRPSCPTCGRIAVEAGWPGLLVSEEHGGAGLGAFDAMLVVAGVRPRARGRAAARAPAGDGAARRAPATSRLEAVADGELRAGVRCPARPPGDVVEPAGRSTRAAAGSRAGAARATVDGDAVTFTGTVAWVPDAPGADVLVVVGVDGDGDAGRGRGRRGGGDGRGGRALRRDPLARPRDARRRARGAARRRRRSRSRARGTSPRR